MMNLFFVTNLFVVGLSLSSCQSRRNISHSEIESAIDPNSKQRINSLNSEKVVYAFRELFESKKELVVSSSRPEYFQAAADYVLLILNAKSGSNDTLACFVDEESDTEEGLTPIVVKRCVRRIKPGTDEDNFIERGYQCLKDYSDSTLCTLSSENFLDLLIDKNVECNSPESSNHNGVDCAIGTINLNRRLLINKKIGEDCVCGVDVSEKLGALKEEVVLYFNNLTLEEKTKLCPSMQTATGWDIRSMFKTEGISNFEAEECGNRNTLCSSTVTVNGKCYFAGEVNYFLYGLGSHLCFNALPGNVSKMRFSKMAMVSSIYIWRKMQTEYGYANGAEERVAWAEVGWDSLDFPRKNEFSTTLKDYSFAVKGFDVCPLGYNGDLEWHLGED